MANVSLLATVADQAASQQAGGAASIMPTGVILPYGASNAPNGWLLCDGSAISRTTFANLFAIVGTSFGTGDGSTTFNLPDLRGRFPRFNDSMGSQGVSGVPAAGAASRDTGRVLGSAQTTTTKQQNVGMIAGSNVGNKTFGTVEQNATAYATTSAPGTLLIRIDNVVADTRNNDVTYTRTLTSGDVGAAETRPINLSVNAIIKI